MTAHQMASHKGDPIGRVARRGAVEKRRRRSLWLVLPFAAWACGDSSPAIRADASRPDGTSHGDASDAGATGAGSGGAPHSTGGQGGAPRGGSGGGGGGTNGGQGGSSGRGALGGAAVSHSGGAAGTAGPTGSGGDPHHSGGAGASPASGGAGGTSTTGTGGSHTGGAGTGGAGTGGRGTGGAATGGAATGGAATGGANTGGAATGGAVSTGGAATGGSGTGGAATGGAGTGGANTGGSGTGGASPGALTLTEGGDYQVIQRILGGTAQSVVIRGTVTGTSIVTVQGQVVDFATGATIIVPWTALGGASGGTYSGSLSIPQGGWYRLVVRGLAAGGAEVARTSGTRRFGVGVNVLCIGQSNMTGFGGFTYTPTMDLAGLFGNDRAWKHLADPYDSGGSSSDVDFDSGTGASMVPSLANALAGYFPGLPIGIIPAARGSSPLDCTADPALCWASRNATLPADPATLYGNSLAKARAAGGVELIVMHQGETDATNMTDGAAYRTELASLAANYRADLGDVPLFFCQLGRSTTAISSKNRTDATMQPIRVAQHDSDNPPRVYLAATAIDLDVDSTDHYTKATYDALGRRIAATIAYHYHAPGAPAAYRGPELHTATYADATRSRIDVHLTHRGGTDFTPASGINGFEVLDGATPVTISSVARKDAATVTITLAAPVAGAGKVRYLYGKLPITVLTNTIHDNSPLALPLEPSAQDLLLP
jgi:hypothetical protein